MPRTSLALALLAAAAGCKTAPVAAPQTPASVAPVPAPAAAAPAPARPLTPDATVEGVSEYHLDNGLKILLFPDDSHDKTTVIVSYMVGSRHEGYGESGMAHLLEHMMFKGTPSHPDMDRELQAIGSVHNASTSYDITQYFEFFPASESNLELVLGLESDRMVNAKVAGEDLAKEFSVVRNEFERSENDQGSILNERMMSTAYLWHNYGKTVIGSRADIERVPIDALQRFYKKYYQPDNAVLIVTGKIDPAHVLAAAQRTFGAIPRPERKLTPTYTVEPVQDGERTVYLRRTGNIQIVGVMYHTVAAADERYVPLQAIGYLLQDRPTGRLYKALVEKGLATSVSAGGSPLYDPGVFEIYAEVPVGKPLEPVRDKIIEVVEGLAKDKPTDEEVARYRAARLKQIQLALTNPQFIAGTLSGGVGLGDWRLTYISRDRVEQVTAAAAASAAATFFKASNRTVGIFTPVKEPDRSPLTERPELAAMFKGYTGHAASEGGEAFEATVDNIEKRTTRKELAPGIKVAFLPRKTRGNTVLLSLNLHYGSEKELADHEDAADAVGALLMRGTKKHTYEQLKSELDRLKAQLSISSNDGDASISVRTIRGNLVEVLALMTEILREPVFPKDQFETMKKERLTSLEDMRSDPASLGAVALERKLRPWPKTDIRYVPTIDESIARLKATTLDEVKRIYKLWGIGHAELAVVGDFNPAEVEAAITKGLGDWKSSVPYARIADVYRPVPPSSETIDTPDKESAYVRLGLVSSMRDDDPDYPAVWMATFIFGNGFQSRLVDRLRKKEGWSYGASAFFAASPLDPRATFHIAASMAPPKAAKALAATLEELARLVKDGVSDEELGRAQVAYRGQFANYLSSDETVLGMLARGLYTGRTLAWNTKVNAAVDALKPADIAAVLKKGYLDPDKLVRVTAGDMKKANAPEAPAPAK